MILVKKVYLIIIKRENTTISTREIIIIITITITIIIIIITTTTTIIGSIRTKIEDKNLKTEYKRKFSQIIIITEEVEGE